MTDVEQNGKSVTEVVDLVRRAERGYVYDPEFHAKAYMAVKAAETSMGGHFTNQQRAIAIRAATLALVVDDLDLTDPNGRSDGDG